MDDINARLAVNPQSVTHILLVNLDDPILCKLLTDLQTFEISGVPHPIHVSFKTQDYDPHTYYTCSTYSDLVMSQAVKLLMDKFKELCGFQVNFLLVKPLEFLSAAQEGMELKLMYVYIKQGQRTYLTRPSIV